MNQEKQISQDSLYQKTSEHFDEMIKIVETAKERAYKKVNKELILIYQAVGKYLSENSKKASYGSNFIETIAEFFARNYPDLKGFNRRGLYRMKQFYELYKDDEKVSPLVTQLTWTNHLKIMSATKNQEERRFYIELAIKEKYSKRELERQIDNGYYECYKLSKGKNLPAIENAKEKTHHLFMDNYIL